VRGKAHSDETRAQVMAALLAGQGINEIAEAYHLPARTIRQWSGQDEQFAEVRQQKRASLDELINEYVEEVFTTLSVQARHFRDLAWLKNQPANEAAVLHGVLTDKAIRILSAAEPVNDPAPDLAPDTGEPAGDGGRE
jgi:argininosuccinate lyase